MLTISPMNLHINPYVALRHEEDEFELLLQKRPQVAAVSLCEVRPF